MLEGLWEIVKNEKNTFQVWYEKSVTKDALTEDSFQCYNIISAPGVWLSGATLPPLGQMQNSPLGHRDGGNCSCTDLALTVQAIIYLNLFKNKNELCLPGVLLVLN